jgi:two-component system sensor histidine kinase UhpB
MAVIVVVTMAAAVFCVRFDLSEKLMTWAHLHEQLQVDELPAVLLVFATCLIWFSLRRYAEALVQLDLRRSTEEKLADALAENQRLAQQYVDMQESERKALARDLHDELGQYLNVIKLDAVSIRDSPASVEGPATARAVIDNVDRVYAVVANLIRQLRPVGFDDLGVAAALEHCVNDWRKRLPAATIDLSIETGLEALDENRALALFRLVQEALTNVARHSDAALVQIRIARRESASRECIDVTIIDDGQGVDMLLPRTGLGLVGMRERLVAFGGSLSLESRRGAGFKIAASLPLGAASPAVSP